MMQGKAVPFILSKEEMQTAEYITDLTVEESSRIDPSVWVDEHGDYLYRYALVRMRDDSLAEDAVQDTLLAAIQSLAGYAGKSSERTWLTSILKHKIIDYYRKNSKNVQFTDEDFELSQFDHYFKRTDEWDGHWTIPLRPVELEETPEKVLEKSEFWDVFNDCLKALPDRVARVFALREMDGLTSEEICEAFALSSSNFWVIMHRARMQLRTCVEFKWFRKVY